MSPAPKQTSAGVYNSTSDEKVLRDPISRHVWLGVDNTMYKIALLTTSGSRWNFIPCLSQVTTSRDCTMEKGQTHGRRERIMPQIQGINPNQPPKSGTKSSHGGTGPISLAPRDPFLSVNLTRREKGHLVSQPSNIQSINPPCPIPSTPPRRVSRCLFRFRHRPPSPRCCDALPPPSANAPPRRARGSGSVRPRG